MSNNWISREKNPLFVIFTDFRGINTPTMVDFKLLSYSHYTQNWEEIWLFWVGVKLAVAHHCFDHLVLDGVCLFPHCKLTIFSLYI